MPAYRIPSPYDRHSPKRRLSGFALALAINIGLLLILMTLGVIPPPSQKTLSGIVVEQRFAPELPPLSSEAELAIYRVAQEA